MKELFIKFLKKHGALRKFKYNLKHVRISSITFDKYCENGIFSDISGAFVWTDTREGNDYWVRLSLLWYNEVEKTK